LSIPATNTLPLRVTTVTLYAFPFRGDLAATSTIGSSIAGKKILRGLAQ
jgi:hypothetical protein